MKKIFVGGSRSIEHINDYVRDLLDKAIELHEVILVGDADGVDSAVQRHLAERHYENVEVFYSGDSCRINAGNWPVRTTKTTSKRKYLESYLTNDVMANEASFGIMVWDGESKGTFANINRMKRRNKGVHIVFSCKPTKKL